MLYSRVATQYNIEDLASGAPRYIDHVLLTAGDRVFVKSQADSSENGIYEVVVPGTGINGNWVYVDNPTNALVLVEEGNTYANTVWVGLTRLATIDDILTDDVNMLIDSVNEIINDASEDVLINPILNGHIYNLDESPHLGVSNEYADSPVIISGASDDFPAIISETSIGIDFVAPQLTFQGDQIYYQTGPDVAISDGGTGASTAADARTNLGLGALAVLNAVAALGDITNVVLTSIADGEVIIWDATNSQWINSSLGAAHVHVLPDLSDVAITGVTLDEMLIWDGTQWINQTLAEAGVSATGHTHIEADITDLDKYTQAQVDSLLAAQDEIGELVDVTITTIVSGELLVWDGTQWINQTLAEVGISESGHTHVEADITDLDKYTQAQVDSLLTAQDELAELVDTSIVSVVSGELLAWSGTAWVNYTPTEIGLSTTGHTHTEADITDLVHDATQLQGVNITITAPTDGQVLKYNAINSQWEPANETSGVTDHGVLTGLGDDDHSQYVHTDVTRTIVVQHTFGPGVAQAPFTLGVNAQGQLVTGLNADQLDGYEASDFANVIHTHVEADITDLVHDATKLQGTNVAVAAPANGQVLKYNSTSGEWEPAAETSGATDHGALTGLGDDDHTQYTLLAGRAGGQTLIGGTGISDDLTLQSTSDVSRGAIVINDPVVSWKSLGIGALAGGYEDLAIHLTGSNRETAVNIYGDSNITAGTVAKLGLRHVSEMGVLRLDASGTVQLEATANGNHVDLNTSVGNVRLWPRGVKVAEISDTIASFANGVNVGVNMDFGVTNPNFPLHINGRLAYGVPNSAPTDANIGAGQVSAYLDETNHKLIFRVKYSDGITLKIGEVALV